MQWAGKLLAIVLASIAFIPVFAQAEVVQQIGPYTVTAYTPQPGDAVYDSGADREVSFWELPLWIQMTYLSGALASIFVAVKLMPFAFLKLTGMLGNQNRDIICRYIEKNPGCTAIDIARNESLNLGSVRYHVYRLAMARKILEVKKGKFTRLFRNNGAYSEREIVVISALNIRTSRGIVSLLGAEPGLSNKQIAERLKIKASLAHVYLSDLVRDRIIRFEMREQRKMYFLESDVYSIIKKAGGRSSAGI